METRSVAGGKKRTVVGNAIVKSQRLRHNFDSDVSSLDRGSLKPLAEAPRRRLFLAAFAGTG